MEAANGKFCKEGGHSLLRDAELCKDVGIVLSHDTCMANNKDVDPDILPTEGTKIPA